jgi:hypothetical protein
MRLKFHKRRVVKFTSQIIPRAKPCGTENIFVGRNEVKASKANNLKITKGALKFFSRINET